MADSRLEGVADLTAQLTELGVKLAARELRGIIGDALKEAEHLARANIPQGEEPHRTYKGRLVSGGFAISTLHIETRLDKRTGSAIATLGVAREAFYATAFVELGTAHMPARPWLRPAFEQSEDAMLKAIGTQMKTRIDSITAKSQRRAAQRARLSRR